MAFSRKILGLAALNLLLVAVVVAAFAEWQFGLSLESLVLGPAHDRIVAMSNAFGRELDMAPYESRGALLASYSQRYGADFYLVSPDGESLAGGQVDIPPSVLEHRREEPFGRGPRRGGANPFFLRHGPLGYWLGIRIPTDGPNGERGVPAVLLIRTHSLFNSRLFFDWRLVIWLLLLLTAVAVVCWWPFVHGVTRSIRQMDRATASIAQGRFDIQVADSRRDELGHLGRQINRMAGRLEGFVKHQKRFLGDIAHELCAPIARIQFALGILEQRVDEAQQSHVTVLREEIQEMSELVNELLLFSKAGMQPADAPLKRVDLFAVVQRAVSHQVPGTGTIRIAIDDGLTAAAHEPYLLRALSNLLRNALRYAGEDGPITVKARRDGDHVLVTVADCGPGLPEQSLEEVFEPFYRLEAARTRDTGGAGLGLAIVKSCVEACRGTVNCQNRKPSGLEVTISLARS